MANGEDPHVDYIAAHAHISRAVILLRKHGHAPLVAALSELGVLVHDLAYPPARPDERFEHPDERAG